MIDYSIEAFGGGTGVADNTAALVSAIAAHGAVFFDPGVYCFTTPVVISVPLNAGCTIAGIGPDVSNLKFASGCGITINLTGGSSSVSVNGLTLMTDGTEVSDGLTINQLSEGTNPAPGGGSSVERVTFRGSDGYVLTNKWRVCCVINVTSNVNFINCIFSGGTVDQNGYTGHGNGILFQGTATKYACAFNVIACTFNYIGGAILYGNHVQGVTISQTNITGGSYGVVSFGDEAGLDQLTITGSQFNVLTAGVLAWTDVPSTMIANNLFILPPNGVGIQLMESSFPSILGNSFNVAATAHVGQTAIMIAKSEGPGGTIVGNTFVNVTTGIYLQAPTSGINVQSNSYVGCQNSVVNQGSANTVGGGSI